MHPSIQEIQSMPEFSIYVDYMRKVLGELLNWGQEEVDALVADNLGNSGFRTWFMHDPWSKEVAWRIIREKIPERVEGLAAESALRLGGQLMDALDPSPDSFNTYLHQDVHYDWAAARHRIQQILDEYAEGA